ncbi:hypothetical protein F66182_3938 [Fusarium sp. NRRL 66182]|nr:hypothetical protein F66182_3938 [Fusarium sp. NRRL 66182]
MAFNFNWSPLTADADFYARARDLLTKALNKSPKPPIIVDDILVSEFNLGTVPPDLEILEIGDLAEDRFRGIFKMTYSGDAFLTLKTRVQANPLNTYLSAKPTFTSPQPLAAASGLTIPLSITLSDFKLSAFIILVFSKQKGLTLVFRNDPLESLKVSSTFDSIQFVRDYLQRTIEQQLRNLMMDELPAIIHRLSLQLWCPDQVNKGTETPKETEDEAGVDPLASPPQDPVDANGNLLDPNAISELTLNGSGEVQSLFSQKNLLRLAALTDSHRTLSLFTPGIRDVVFRAWTGHDRSETATPLVATPSLTKTMSFHAGNSTTYTFSDTASSAHGHLPSRPSLVSMNSSGNGLSLGAGGRSRAGRKKKTRVVNLRRSKSETATPETGSEAEDTASVDVPLSEPVIDDSIPEETEASIIAEASTPHKTRLRSVEEVDDHPIMANLEQSRQIGSPVKNSVKPSGPKEYGSIAAALRADKARASGLESQSVTSENSSVILEQAWIMKMAGEIAKRVYDEKHRQRSPWDEREDAPPPAYEAATR